MSKLLKDPMGNGSKLWAEDILTSMGINVDEAVNIEIGENSNGEYIKFPNGLVICFMAKTIANDVNTSFSTPYQYSVPPVAVTKTKTSDVSRPMVLGALGLWK